MNRFNFIILLKLLKFLKHTAMKKEHRVYVVNFGRIENDFDMKDTELFIAESERQGTVYTIEGFEQAFNSTPFAHTDYIKIVEVNREECITTEIGKKVVEIIQETKGYDTFKDNRDEVLFSLNDLSKILPDLDIDEIVKALRK